MGKEQEISRRCFLRTAGLLGTATLVPTSDIFAQNSTDSSEKQAPASQVPVRPFGKSGINVSILALGGMFDIPSNQLMLKQALKWGVNYWDTADCYEGGNSEKGIGQFFKKYPESRKNIFLVTKSDARDPKGMSKLLAQSLERMNTDYIDLYLLHGLSSIDEINQDTKAWAEKTKSEGKIKLFGFSAHSNMEPNMLAAAKLGWIDGIMMSYNFRLMHSDKMKAAVDACVKSGIGLAAMKTQGGGQARIDSELELELAGRFMKMGFTDKQAKLKAVWENPHIASICSQMPNMTILMANTAAAMNQTKLSSQDVMLMYEYAQQTASGYCAGCTHICESALGSSVPVGDIMRCLMYFNEYGEYDWAKTLFARIPSVVRNHLLNINYTPAETLCPQTVAIGTLVKQAVTLFA